MNRYKWHDQEFRAWSEMPCNKVRGNRNTNPPTEAEDHQPHVWDGEFTIYGPYYCPGRNPVAPCVPKHRRSSGVE